MKKRTLVLVAVLGAPLALLPAGAVTAGYLVVRDGWKRQSTCQELLPIEEAKVRTDRWDPPEDLPGLDDYPAIHWQVRAKGNPCTWGPGPTDWAYQGVVKLRPEDARAFAERYDFVAYDPVVAEEYAANRTPEDVWPALAGFLPPEPRWLTSRVYDELDTSSRWRTGYLDVEHATLLFMLDDH
ncbi:hypothetical protein E1211_10320 [Micromonospora sp. 15K316]|uniref:hypothetical protein n=1 Tax=Micromonospora sp. 15K316 TaxID=2530376 RepID=UPI00104D9602|nr:hypothetical protein [Micromonospora sp. 15K316]TDC37469.1 hypothetical protein E1211_10320 [Micromonospora sp. 15K316]